MYKGFTTTSHIGGKAKVTIEFEQGVRLEFNVPQAELRVIQTEDDIYERHAQPVFIPANRFEVTLSFETDRINVTQLKTVAREQQSDASVQSRGSDSDFVGMCETPERAPEV